MYKNLAAHLNIGKVDKLVNWHVNYCCQSSIHYHLLGAHLL